MPNSGVSRTRRAAMFRRRRQSLVVAACAFMGSLGAVAGIMMRQAPLPALLGGSPGLPRAESILLLGVADDPALGHGPRQDLKRTDAVLVATLQPDQRTVHVLSIPSDSQVLIPGYGTGRIAVAFEHGGVKTTRDVVEALLGISVAHTVQVSEFEATRFMDHLGGVDVFIEKPMHYEDHAARLLIDLKPGWQKLDGQAALGFARFRHDSLGDIGRVGRQQMLLHAIEQTIINPISYFGLPDLGKTASRLFKSDLTPKDYAALVGFFKRRPSISYTTLPGEFGKEGDWIPNHGRIVSLLDHLNAGLRTPKAKAGLASMVEVLYAPNQAQAAAKLAETMTDRGLTVVRTAPVPEDLGVSSRIIGRNASPALDPTLASLMPNAPWQLSDDESPYSADYTVVLGPDFR